jgi:WD40 repeat protein
MICFDKFIAYASEKRIFYFDQSAPNDIDVISGLPNDQQILEFYANNHSLYATSLDKFVLRFSVVDGKLALVKSLDLKSAASKDIGTGDDLIYVLRSNGEIDEIDAFELTVKRTHKHGIDATCMTYSAVSKELWIGDKKGMLHVLNTADFACVHKIEKHSKTVTCITASNDGALIASGDGYRY